MPKPINITASKADQLPRFSICTLVTRPGQYEAMLESFACAGFSEPDAEYLYIDNTTGNHFDAFQAIRHFLTLARGQYVILCHQDILLSHDNIQKLDACICELNRLDPQWAVLGNAGGVELYKTVYHLTDPRGECRANDLPRKVQSLDENFILLRRDCNPGVSADMRGFHLYGLDLCLQAALRGFNAYVVDFHLTHLSPGNPDATFTEARAQMIEKYRKVLCGRYFQTTCTEIYLSGSWLAGWVFNHRKIKKWHRSFLKRLGRI